MERFTVRKRGAFTLVELLVVVTILTAMLALLLPSLKAAREASRRAVCASNLHQWSIAYMGYAADNFTQYPYNDGKDVSWNGSIVRNFFNSYMAPLQSNTVLGKRTTLFCPSSAYHAWFTQTWPTTAESGGLVGYFDLPHRDKVTVSFASPAADWSVGRTRLGQFKGKGPLVSDMIQTWYLPVTEGRYANQTGLAGWDAAVPLSSHVDADGWAVGGNFLHEDGSVAWYSVARPHPARAYWFPSAPFTATDTLAGIGAFISFKFHFYFRIEQ